MYKHYSFDDPWIFPVDMEEGQIKRSAGEAGEVPNFKWFSNNIPDEFGYRGLL